MSAAKRRIGRLSLFALFAILTRQTLGQDIQVCSSDGRCQNDQNSVLPQLQNLNKADSCPASDCDGTGILEHHLGDQNTGRSLACSSRDSSDNLTTVDNEYFRCFKGPDLCTSDRIVDSVYFRVGTLTGSDVDVTVSLFIGDGSGCDNAATVEELSQQTPVLTTDVTVSQGIFVPVDVPMLETVEFLASESLLVGLSVPSLVDVGQFFLADSDDANEGCDRSYSRNTLCEQNVVTPAAGFGESFEQVSFVLGVRTSPAPTPSPTVSPPEPGCFESVVTAIICLGEFLFEYLFGWLLPF